MANTVNGQSAITASSHRETSGIQIPRYRRAHQGQVLRARINYDTNLGTAFTIDSPIVDVSPSTGSRIYVVGLSATDPDAGYLQLLSKVGSSSAVQLKRWDLAANSGVELRVEENPICYTDQNGVLQINSDVARTLTIDYIIADSLVLC